MKSLKLLGSLLVILVASLFGAAQSPQTSPTPATQKTPALSEFKDEFDGAELDAKKWEQYSLEGGGKIKIEKGRLQTNGAGGSRFGVRSVQTFSGDKFAVSAQLTKLSAGLSQEPGTPTGNAILVILFDGGANRIEWILNTDGRLEAWAIRDGQGEKLDGNTLATKEKSPTLGIGRRGDDYFFMINNQVGLQKKIKNLPATFRVMLYGFGKSKDEWESVSVITPEQK